MNKTNEADGIVRLPRGGGVAGRDGVCSAG